MGDWSGDASPIGRELSATGVGRRRRATADRLEQATAELGTEQAVDDEVDARVDVDEQLGAGLQVEYDVAAAVARDRVADAVERGQRRLADDRDQDHRHQDERHLARGVRSATAAAASRLLRLALFSTLHNREHD